MLVSKMDRFFYFPAKQSENYRLWALTAFYRGKKMILLIPFCMDELQDDCL